MAARAAGVTENGTEFSNPHAIEFDCEGNRFILPKGNYCLLPTSFDDLTQEDVDLMMSHVNSYIRSSLGDKMK